MRTLPAARSAHRRARLSGVLAATCVVVLGLGACTADDRGSPAPSPPPAATSTTRAPESSSGGIGPLSPVTLTVAGGVDPGSAGGRALNLPAGWAAQVWANVPSARMAAWSPDGRLVVTTGGRGVVAVLTPTSDGAAPAVTTLLDGLDNPQGVAFAEREDRTVLVVGEETRLVAWDYADGATSNRRVIVDGLPGGGHGAKAVAIRDGIVSYSLGSSGNREPADRTATPERATLWQVALDGTGNHVVAHGVRNGFGLAFAPDGTLFAAVNQSDNQPYPYRDGGAYGGSEPGYVNDNPVEQVTRISPGVDLGWPYCIPDARGLAQPTDVPFVDDPEHNVDGEALDCDSIGTTMIGLPAHSAPLGLAFTTGSALPAAVGDGALIAAHGSWNRQPPRPPSVAYSPWDATTATLGAPVELITGFQDGDGSRWGRPVAAVPGADGSIYLTDDDAGLVYRITPAG